jgi:C4-dicarboxylate-specific signal transduction histidine kinase
MLYLQLPAAAGATSPPRVPLAELTALGFERALLAPDAVTRQRELAMTLARDPASLAWVVHISQVSKSHSVDPHGDAMAWLAPRLEFELAAALAHSAEGDSRGRPAAEIEFRLPALANRLAECARAHAEFDSRLEHEKLPALKELAYGASHEINNPLANIAARAQTLLEEETEPERRRKLIAIHRQAMRAHEMIADLMLFARPPKLSRAPCDLADIARTVRNELSMRAEEQSTELWCGLEHGPLVVSADATHLAVAVHAVVTNALEAVGEGGQVHICVQACEIAGKPWGEIAIRDDGPGVSGDVRRHMFDPFFSGREAGRGLGFGLSKCWRIVTEHGGQVLVRQPSDGGTEISLQLPLLDQPAQLEPTE